MEKGAARGVYEREAGWQAGSAWPRGRPGTGGSRGEPAESTPYDGQPAFAFFFFGQAAKGRRRRRIGLKCCMGRPARGERTSNFCWSPAHIIRVAE